MQVPKDHSNKAKTLSSELRDEEKMFKLGKMW